MAPHKFGFDPAIQPKPVRQGVDSRVFRNIAEVRMAHRLRLGRQNGALIAMTQTVPNRIPRADDSAAFIACSITGFEHSDPLSEPRAPDSFQGRGPHSKKSQMQSTSKNDEVFIHPMALVETSDIGAGTKVWAFAQVMSGAYIGSNCNIGGHAFLEAGAHLGSRVTLKNQVMVWNGVTIEDDVFVGPGVIFTNDLNPRSPRMPAAAERYSNPSNWLGQTRIGRGASIGAGSVILPVNVGTHAAAQNLFCKIGGA